MSDAMDGMVPGEVKMFGTVALLNVGEGDTKLSFDPKNEAERIRAARVVKDMLRRGYALLVEVEVNGEKINRRVYDFDATKCEYIIADFDSVEAAKHDENEVRSNEEAQPAPAAPPREASPHRGKKRTTRVPAEKARTVAVARTAGG